MTAAQVTWHSARDARCFHQLVGEVNASPSLSAPSLLAKLGATQGVARGRRSGRPRERVIHPRPEIPVGEGLELKHDQV